MIHATAMKQVTACEYNPAEAMLPGCKMPEVRLREGEKLHEIMVTVEDSMTTYEYDKHFIIYP